MGDYAGYVISAYAVAFLAIGGLIAWVLADRAAAKRELGKAERASARSAGAGNAR